MAEAAAAADWSWVCRLMQAGDSAYPTGAYAHSLGLEGVVESGAVRDLASLRSFVLFQLLPQLARTDLPVAVLAWDAAGAPDWERLRHLCYLGRALRGTRELRAASEAVGRQRAAMASLLHGGLAAEFDRRSREGGWPVPSCVASGLECRALGAPRGAVPMVVAAGAVSGAVAAAVKLLRLGQNAAQGLAAEALARCSEFSDTNLPSDAGALGSANPWWDLASCRHETADFRLFIS